MRKPCSDWLLYIHNLIFTDEIPSVADTHVRPMRHRCSRCHVNPNAIGPRAQWGEIKPFLRGAECRLGRLLEDAARLCVCTMLVMSIWVPTARFLKQPSTTLLSQQGLFHAVWCIQPRTFLSTSPPPPPPPLLRELINTFTHCHLIPY